MAQIDIRDEKLLKLMKIQKVIREEEGINSSLDESPLHGSSTSTGSSCPTIRRWPVKHD